MGRQVKSIRGRLPMAGAGIAMLFLLSSCADAHVDRGPERPDPSEPPTGRVLAFIEEGDTTFTMHDESEDCLAVHIEHPGLQSTVKRSCSDHWDSVRRTSSCGWLTREDTEDSGWCDIVLPTVFYGRVTNPHVGYACVGVFNELSASDGVTGARILERDSDGYILTLAEPGERPPLHFLSAGGSRIGDPPLDAPSEPIYRFCEAAAGMELAELVYRVSLRMQFDESLRSDDIVAFVHSGLDRIGVSGGAFEGEEYVDISVRVTEAAKRFEITVEFMGEPISTGDVEWPPEVIRLLTSGQACNDLTIVDVHIGGSVATGIDHPVDVSFVSSECPI